LRAQALRPATILTALVFEKLRAGGSEHPGTVGLRMVRSPIALMLESKIAIRRPLH
jgi:hypothetical protein